MMEDIKGIVVSHNVAKNSKTTDCKCKTVAAIAGEQQSRMLQQ